MWLVFVSLDSQFVFNVLNVILRCYLSYSPGVIANIYCECFSFMFDCYQALILSDIIVDIIGLLYLFFMMPKGGIITD